MTYVEFLAARQLVAEMHIGRDLRAAQDKELSDEEEAHKLLRKQGLVT